MNVNNSYHLTPHHIAIIMDGNNRWAKNRLLPRLVGHKKGAEAANHIVQACRKYHVPFLTLYAFSTENWNRPNDEVTELMNLLRHYLQTEISQFIDQNIRLRVIGDRLLLDDDLQQLITNLEHQTAHHNSLTVCIALSYGSRQEICRAVQRYYHTHQTIPHHFTPDDLAGYLDSNDIPDPDLIIRTGGELRLSNFLLWQSAYSELFFTPILWPDFTESHLQEAIHHYAKRERRYGTRP
jgi:undecaprenyl diphosphate synthase